MELEYKNGVCVPKKTPEIIALREHKQRIKRLETKVQNLEIVMKEILSLLLGKGDNTK